MEEIIIERYLLNKGIPPHVKGFGYLVDAIWLCQKDKNYLYNLTTKLYPKIAEKICADWRRVERALRTAIDFLERPHTIGSFLGTALIEIKEILIKGE